ncbi:MAG: ABC transporter substrate-binding protein [Desulforhabdus sp.]|jgi:ABC-type oligopeptide transport system substrate-binding subunit|nr:ABC transporter substrate-binding protein [Desulforhabdus sp.]
MGYALFFLPKVNKEYIKNDVSKQKQHLLIRKKQPMRYIQALLCVLVIPLWSFFLSLNCDAGTTVYRNGGGIYRAPLLNNPSTLDPPYVQDIYGVAVVHQLFDGLVQFDSALFVVPALAENWQVTEGGKTYRFSLRSNAKFHNGRPVTSRDVVFSLERVLRIKPPPSIQPHLLKIMGAEEYQEGDADDVSGLTIVDDKTLLIHLSEPYAPFLIALGMYQGSIVPKDEVIKDGEDFGRSPIGSGAFKFESWQESKKISLARFPEYYGGPALLDSIEYLIYPGVGIEEVLEDFRSGKLEQMPIFGNVGQILKERKDLQWLHRPSLSIQFYGINCQHPKLKDPNLRSALSMAINRKELIASVYGGRFEPARTILPPGLPGYDPSGQRISEDKDRALHFVESIKKEKPDTIGPIEIVSNSESTLAKAELDFIAKSWGEIGVSMKPRFIPDWPEFEAYLKSDALQIYRYAWFADIPDPDDFLRTLFSSNSPANFMRYSNPEVDKMLQEALGMVEPLQRAQTYQDVEGIILQSSPIIPILYMSNDFVFQPYVDGIQISPLGAQAMSFHQVSLKADSLQ